MSAKLRSVKPRPLKGSSIRNILANNQHLVEEHLKKPVKPTEPIILKSEIEYDSLHPEEELRRIVSFLKNVKERYETNR